MGTRRRGPWGLLAVLFVVVPLLELYVVIQTGQAIGAGWTILLLVVDSALGALLIKHQGRQAWNALREALQSYKMPARELADGALILVGGTLLLTPGFLTDIAGFLLVLPFTRPVARRALASFVSARLLSSTEGARTRQRPGPDAVVQGEVVD
jgi:UPF0716 protein FxsA